MACGEATAKALVELRMNESVTIPKAAFAKSKKVAMLAAVREEGMTVNQLAKKFDVTARYARRIIGRKKAPNGRPGKASAAAGEASHG
jgi:transposase-like protein